MDIYEYWIGDGIDYMNLWRAYEEGEGYKKKYSSMTVHLIQFTFKEQHYELPLFNHEAVYKTIKGYSHEIKRVCFSSGDYQRAGPIFLYELNRGSSIWSFLGELRQILLLGTTLADEKVIGQRLDNIDKKLEILRKYFGGAVNPEDFMKFMNAKTPDEIENAVHELIRQGIQKVEVSKIPFVGKIEDTKQKMIDIKKELEG